MVFIPKGGNDYCGTGLVDVLWKVVIVIINCRLSTTIYFHEVLHEFWEVRGMGTTSIEAKLLQQLTDMREGVLYAIFLDLKKVYESLGRDIYLEILEIYGLVPRDLCLVCTYW